MRLERRRTWTDEHDGQHIAVICVLVDPRRSGSRISGGAGGRSSTGMMNSPDGGSKFFMIFPRL